MILLSVSDRSWMLCLVGIKIVFWLWVSILFVCNDDCYGWGKNIVRFICYFFFGVSLCFIVFFMSGLWIFFVGENSLICYKVVKWVRLVKDVDFYVVDIYIVL